MQLKRIYAKIAKPLAILFAAFALLILIDYVTPREVYFSAVKDLRKVSESRFRSRANLRYSYNFRIGGQKIQIDEETYRNVYTGDLLEVHKTRILRKITDLHHVSNSHIDVTIYVMPYTNFPLYPILFFLPIVFAFIKGETVFLMTARPLSNGVALLCLVMTLI